MKNRFPPKKILVGVDGSQPSFAALWAAKALAGSLGASLGAVYVEQPILIAEVDPPSWTVERERRELRLEIERRVSSEGIPLRVLRGQPAAELVRLATARTADLLVLGTHGRQGADRFLMGSIAEAVFHRARVPVLAIREDKKLEPGGVLVPCNLEAYADEALLYAYKLAGAFGCPVTALLVAPVEEWERDADERLRAHIELQLGTEAARAILRRVRKGEAREQMALEARERPYGLVVLSGHRRAALSDLALGTTAERLLRRCPAPLLVVPASAA